MKKLLSLPTWILMMVMKPILPNGHPLKKDKIKLSDWNKNGTELLYAFDLAFWVIIISLSSLFLYIL